MNTPEYEATIEFVIYDNDYEFFGKSFKLLRLDGHAETSFIEFIADRDTTSLILMELGETPDGVTCYQCKVTYSYDEGDMSVGLYPGWLFGFDLDTLKQTHPVEEQYYLPEPEYDPPQDEGHWSDDEDYEFRKWIAGSNQEPLFKNKETK